MVDTNHNTTSTSTGPSEEREEREDFELQDMRPINVIRHASPVEVLRQDYDIQAKRIDEVMSEKRIPLNIRPIGRIRKEIDILLQKHLTGELDDV